MGSPSRRLLAHYARCIALACVASAASLLISIERPLAHEGHDQVPERPSAAEASASPRVIATSETYHFVGIVEGEVLVIYLDRAEDNAPVMAASIEVTVDGEPFRAEPQEGTGTYEVTVPQLKKPGSHEILVSLSDGTTSDLLVGTLRIPATSDKAGDGRQTITRVVTDALASFPGGRIAALAGGALLLVVVAGTVFSRRRRLGLPPIVIVAAVVLATAVASAHEGHDHGPDLSVSAGNSPSRRPDGSIFLPKPTQRLLEVRTRTATIETRMRTVRFNGRVVANPNRSGVVQSTIQGRYEAPEGGVSPLGSRVMAGDLLGRVAPSFASIDSSDMAQTLGNLDQEIALSRSKLARQEQLLRSNVAARATVEDIRLQLEGLEKRRRELLAAKVRPEELRAPVDGVIAMARVVAGQVVAPSDQLFQIIDPTSLLVEALLFDQVDPDAVDEATALVGGDSPVKLKFIGRSRALQQQYSIMQFQIVESRVLLNVGAPVTVVASTGKPVTGILLPRTALAQAPNGQTIVFTQKEPEIFLPRPVRTEPFDGQSVLVTGGIAPGDKVVVQNAPLINQVR